MSPEELLAEAREVAKNAYAPYSGFRVGAVIVADDGSVHRGVNWENAAYPSGTCAEASAIASAVTAGKTAMKTVAVACIDAGTEAETFPCGQCRQRLYEFGVETVVVSGTDGTAQRYALDELLPHGFRLEH
ncbi:MAG: cytidine deaminase [Gammaproteobacteria bacterium]|nr:cytidine deaminase [Gammaproteobacteria bacterium]